MRHSWLQCDWCHSQFEPGPLFYGCPACLQQGKRRPLEMKYGAKSIEPGSPHGIWRWASALPAVEENNRATLHEGMTPLVPLESKAPGPLIHLKNETSNPTWSWKDRPNAISISVARQFGYERVVTKSTGNHGNSMAAYASAFGLNATVLCNLDTPALQLALMEGYGARVISGGAQDQLISRLLSEDRFFPCTILCPQSGYSNPYGVEGFKTIAYEIVESLGGQAPDRVFVGTGSGDGIYGIWKGFRELAERGQIGRRPRMIGCQAEGANSAFRAWRSGLRHVEPLASLSTRARSVAEPATGDHALRAVYESNGEFMQVPDAEIEKAATSLLRRGFALELASALTYACACRSSAESPLPLERWIIMGSGAAVKWPETFVRDYAAPLTRALTTY